MKRIFLWLIVFSIFNVSLQAFFRTDKTFVHTRPQGVNLPMELSILRRAMYKAVGNAHSVNIQVTPFYQESTNAKDLARYFLFDHKKSLKVASTAVDPNADIDPVHFNLSPMYQGAFSLKPRQETLGLRFDLYKNLGKGLFLAASVPLVRVKNDPGLKESVVNRGGQKLGPQLISETLRGDQLTSEWQEVFKFGKVDGEQEKTGVADIDVKCGFKFIENERFAMGIYVAGTIRTGNKPKAVFIFEPMIGNGHHFALGGGFHLDIQLMASKKQRKKLYLLIYGDYRYLFRASQRRTLELTNKNWGRYLQMRKQDSANVANVLINAVPGVNVLTRRVYVTPRSQVDGIAALSYLWRNLEWLVGYNIYVRQRERVRLKDAFEKEGVFGLTSSNATLSAGPPVSFIAEPAATAVSSQSTIKSQVVSDGLFVSENILDSASVPAVMSHKVFGTLAYTFKGSASLWLGCGGSYEFPSKNSTLEQWILWGMLGLAF